jgi:hypothetical protein
VTTEAAARAAADSAEATTRSAAIAALTSDIGNVSASVTTEAAARVSGDAANASSITSLQSNFGALRTQGKALNTDPHFYDSSLWTTRSGTPVYGLSGGAVSLQCISSQTGTNNCAVTQTKGMTVDLTKWYRLTAMLRKDAGADGDAYMRYSTFSAADANTGDVDVGLSPIPNASISTSWARHVSAPFQVSTNYVSITLNLNQSGTTGVMRCAEFELEEISDYADISANALIKMTTSATAAGADASIAIQVAATAGGTHSDAGIYLDAMTAGGSQIRLEASTIRINGTLLNNGALLDANLAVGSVTGQLHPAVGNVTDPSPGSGTEFTLKSGSLTCSGRPTLVVINLKATNTVFPGETCDINLYVDGSLLYQWQLDVSSAGGTYIDSRSVGPNPTQWYTPSVGAHTFALKCQDISLGGTFTLHDVDMLILDIKK